MAPSTSDEGNWNDLSWRKLLRDDPDDVFRASDWMIPDRDDHVSAADERRAEQLLLVGPSPEPGLCAGRIRVHLGYDRAMRNRVVEPFRDRRDQVLSLDSHVRMRHAPRSDQLRHRPPRRVDWHRETDTFGAAGVAADLCVDPNHAAARVEKRAARIPVVDRRIGLDR